MLSDDTVEDDHDDSVLSTLVLHLARPEGETSNTTAVVSVGSCNIIHLAISGGTGGKDKCRFPQFYVRFVGPTLVGVHMIEISNNLWRGYFNLPIEGTYDFDMRWYGCNSNEGQPPNATGDVAAVDTSSWRHPTVVGEPISLHAVGSSNSTSVGNLSSSQGGYYYQNEQLFAPDSVWWKASLVESLNADDQEVALPTYMWMSPANAAMHDKGSKLYKAPNSTVSTEGTLRHPKDYYGFGGLGNYEVVCWLGSESSADSLKAFSKLKAKIFPGQKPFKFHYHPIKSFVHPDTEWSVGLKKQFRKCKHILVSLDEPNEPVSQSVYKQQVTTFVGHLLKAFDDETFPIWLFSVIEPPMKATNCYNPSKKTTDHPCNDVLKDLFRPDGSSETFPPQVHFLDNTDLTLPQFDENRDDILAVIGMRTLVLVGKGVADWRAMKQKGSMHGLFRNGTLLNNTESVPYEGW